MEEKKRKAAIEAILFTMGDAVELNRIAEAIGEDPETTLETIRKMMKDYQKKERGIQVIELDHSFQLCTKKEYYDDLIRMRSIRKNRRFPTWPWRRFPSWPTNSR